jgi:5-aminopentanamidase
MLDKVVIAGVQMEPKIFQIKQNLEKIIYLSTAAYKTSAKVVVFPEFTLSGYCFESLEEVISVAEPIPGPATEKLHKLCSRLDLLVLFGLVEKDGDQYFNAAALVGVEGLIGKYRKIHLPLLGGDRFVTKGNIPFRAYGTKYGKLGWIICYDGAFPESSRVLALQGAELIALLTNWPVGGSETSPKYVVPTRAIENRVNYIAVNRVGIERGFRFIGQSRIVDYVGNILAEAGAGEKTIYAEIDLAGAREKKTVIIPGIYELDRFQTRSPEFYGPLVDPSLGK